MWATTIQITHPWDSAILREHLATMCYTIFHKRDIYQQANGICNNCKLVYILHLEFTYVSVPHQSGSVSSSRSLIAFKESLKRLGLRLRQEPTLRDSQNWLTSTLNTWERCQIKIPTNERNYWVTKKRAAFLRVWSSRSTTMAPCQHVQWLLHNQQVIVKNNYFSTYFV